MLDPGNEPYVDRIRDCRECPFSYPQWRRSRHMCVHDAGPGDDCEDPRRVLGSTRHPLPAPPPEWCPLREKPTLVVLETS